MSSARGGRRTYRSERREAQARRTRQRVVEAATTTFLVAGYRATTMRTIAAAAGVAVPTVESLFGTKANLLSAAIDVAIAGDDEPVAVLDREWAGAALAATGASELVEIAAPVLAAAQERSAGLVLAALEGAANDATLAALAEQLTAQRERTATWLVDQLASVAALRPGCDPSEAIDTMWLLMDPVVFDRMTRYRSWSTDRYQQWFAESVIRLLVDPDHN